MPSETPLERALAFIEWLATEPLLIGNEDDLAEIEDIREHAKIELASIRSLSAAEGVKVRPAVKPLEWEAGLNGDLFALSICGTYSIQAYDAFAALQLPGQKIRDRANWLTVNGARAAAQADYEARIRSALQEGA